MRTALLIGLVIVAMAEVGCANPDATSVLSGTEKVAVQNAGEPTVPPAPPSATQAPAAVQKTPGQAARRFAVLYVNWTYRTLAAHQRTLASIAVGAARLSERQAAASAQGDTTIARGHIRNRGQVVEIGPDSLRSGWWTIVTREQTGGNSQYEGLPASYHVTLAQIAPVPDGFAVEQWLPQS